MDSSEQPTFLYPIPPLTSFFKSVTDHGFPSNRQKQKQNFRGQHGKAYLFNSVVNIAAGDPSERSMTTGRHIVRDINCKQCRETVGWKYDKAYESSEKYKEGKFILEAELLCNVS